jgi:hypothetical protein
MAKPIQPVVRHQVDPNDLPFTAQAYDEDTGELLWHQLIEKPGEILVPGWSPRRVRIKLLHRDGSSTTVMSDGTTHKEVDDVQALLEANPQLRAALEEIASHPHLLHQRRSADADQPASSA